MIISFVNQKGGVGKTTLSLNIAYGLSLLTNSKSLLIDSDPQGSCLDWKNARDIPINLDVFAMPKSILHKEIKNYINKYANIVIDTPPHSADIAKSAMLASDIILIPVQPSPFDLWSAAETVKAIKEAQVFNERLKVYFIISRKIVGTVIAKSVNEALKDYGIGILKTQISQRIDFPETATNGKSVLEKSGDAKHEIKKLIEELQQITSEGETVYA